MLAGSATVTSTISVIWSRIVRLYETAYSPDSRWKLETLRALVIPLSSSTDSISVQVKIGPSNVSFNVTCIVGDSVGSNVGVLLTCVGTTVDNTEGPNVGTSVNVYDGSNVGTSDEAYEGHIVGTNVGSWLGYSVPAQYLPVGNRVEADELYSASSVGESVVHHFPEGTSDGTLDGLSVGESVLCTDGLSVGISVGNREGDTVGRSVAVFASM